jgi:hypothetical protein
VLTSPVTFVRSFTVSSLTPPHCGNIGPCFPCPDAGADDPGDWDWSEPEWEHAATTGTKVAAARASAATSRRTATETFC